MTLFGCKEGNNNKTKAPISDSNQLRVNIPDTTIRGNFESNSKIKFDSTAITQFLSKYPALKEFSNDYKAFYRIYTYNYVWYDKNGLIEPATALHSKLQNLESEGITATIPYMQELHQQLNINGDTMIITGQKPDITAELLLTGQYFFYAKNVWKGAVSEKTENIDWYLPRKKISYNTLLENNLKTGDLNSIENEVLFPQYTGLKKALAFYRDIEKKAALPDIPLLKTKKTLRLNDSAAQIPLIRSKLQLLGYTSNISASAVYEQSLSDAINKYKSSVGLKADALITNEMITQLNVPVKKRMEDIIVNMERFRWVPASIKADEFLLVNIPEYSLRYFEKGKETWQSNVVVGRPLTKTVIFSGEMKYVVFSPYWYVPPSIINKEIKPGMKKSASYLARHNMEWNGGNVRQKPGKSNALGLVKFLFPNSNSIYLHDTPSKSLFSEDSRAFSHGCVRVGKPKELAIKILRQDPSWTPEKIEAAMNSGKEQYVTLKKKIPVYIGYFTAFIDKDGALHFRKDIYQRNNRLLGMLMENK